MNESALNKTFSRAVLKLLATLALSVGVTLSLPLLITLKWSGHLFSLPPALAISLIAVSMVAFALTITFSIFRPFRLRVNREGKAAIFGGGFLAIVICFGAFYFFIVASYDWHRASRINTILNDLGRSQPVIGRVIFPGELPKPAFSGIRAPIFQAYGEDGPAGPAEKWSANEVAEFAKRAKINGVPLECSINDRALWDITVDCVHFSFVTAATVGFGDIVPVSSSAKLTVDLQIVISAFFLIYGYAFITSSEPAIANRETCVEPVQ